MRTLRNMALMLLIFFMACSVKLSESELIEDPMFVTVGLFAVTVIYAIVDAFIPRGE